MIEKTNNIAANKSINPIFELKNVTKQFGNFSSIKKINLKIYPGERVALLGSSGAGKSTLINLLNGTVRPTSGEVWVLGKNLALKPATVRQIQRQIGTIYQQLHLVDNLQVIHNVNAGHLGRWTFWQAAFSLVFPLEVATATRALTQVGIAEKLYQRCGVLSGGQQQRVAIARVLVQNPAVILADEPIASLDPERSREIIQLLCQLNTQLNKTLVTSLHDWEVARNYYQRIVGLSGGEVLFDSPANLVTLEMVDGLYKQAN
ncbi:phosphonate ABC transporter ATP-binding protein [Synechocystis sp. PCC 7509]|uniref:phosphonate ABC transporter ATP-binding protein n=1 Tax=Synechocystis sp. PCC 7509 TaxID=927677 RepID=UPI0002ACECB1|nr:phosphonate ABC transporter ATP-binding protein [Synechocystis sp. PCC 7509]